MIQDKIVQSRDGISDDISDITSLDSFKLFKQNSKFVLKCMYYSVESHERNTHTIKIIHMHIHAILIETNEVTFMQ